MREDIEDGRDSPNIPSPGELIRQEMKARGWTQADLAQILDRPLPTVNEIIQGKRAIMPEMARALSEAFGSPAELWMQREAMYRLSLAQGDFRGIKRRARLHDLVPLKEIQKRGWIKPGDDENTLDAEVLQFLEIGSLDDEPQISTAMRKSDATSDLTPAQRAWCFRVKHLARALKVDPFDPARLGECEAKLSRLAAYPVEARKVSGLLASFGVRLVIVEPLSGSKIDGVAMWLDSKSPVIGLSLRFDRIDGFWFTLCHEFSHIKNGDALSIDTDLTGQDQAPSVAKSPIERRADSEAAAMLIPPSELESFILRVGPQYSKDRIVQFAHRIKIHPGIIVGQLQHRGELGYHSMRDMLIRIRGTVTPSSVTDGWGHSIDVGGPR